MRKTLKFSKDLVPLITSGEKSSTWRLWDDKNLSVRDRVDFLQADSGIRFSTGIIIRVVNKTMGELTAEDKAGHESFQNEEEMYRTYSGYYGRAVTPETPVKICWFEIISP
jgi:hypothetical protein